MTKLLETLKEKLNQIKTLVGEFEQVLQDLEENEMAKSRNNVTPNEILLDNGMVGKVYADQITAQLLGVEQLYIQEIEGLDKIEGLEFNQETNSFEGTPTQAGAFEMKFFYKTDLNNEVESSCTILLTINPDPDSLWLDIETDPNAPYPKENTYSEYIEADEFHILAGSIRGRSHAHVGTFRDDHFVQQYFTGKGWHFQAVSDGAGSAQYSREGSKIACEVTLSQVENFMNSEEFEKLEELLKAKYVQQDDSLDNELSTSLYYLTAGNAYKAYQAIKKEAESKGNQVKDYSATLLFTLHKEFEFGTILISFWVGDGAIGALVEDQILLLGTPDGGEYAGQTRFVTMPEIFREGVMGRIGFRCIEKPMQALFLMTDGISDPKFETDGNLGNVQMWADLWEELKENVLAQEDKQNALLKWMAFHSKGNHDDRSLSILFPSKLLNEFSQEEEIGTPENVSQLLGTKTEETSKDIISEELEAEKENIESEETKVLEEVENTSDEGVSEVEALENTNVDQEEDTKETSQEPLASEVLAEEKTQEAEELASQPSEVEAPKEKEVEESLQEDKMTHINLVKPSDQAPKE